MPQVRNTRDRMRRNMDQAKGNIEQALTYLAEFWEIYKPAHEELAEQVSIIMEGLDISLDAIDDLKTKF